MRISPFSSLLILFCMIFDSRGMNRNIFMVRVQKNHQKKQLMERDEFNFLTSILSQDGFYLKNILRLNSLGYCSVDIIAIDSLLKKYNTEVWANLADPVFRFNKDVIHIAQSIAQRSTDQRALLGALINNQFNNALKIFQKNSYVLHTYEGETVFDVMSCIFAGKFNAVDENSLAYESMKELLHKGFDLNIRDNNGRSLLCNVIMAASTKKCQDVLRGGVSVNLYDYRGKSPMHYAVLLGNEDKVKALLAYGGVVHPDMFMNGISRSLFSVLTNAFKEQKCIKCQQYCSNISNISCINRHMGHFICKYCYDYSPKYCPLCRRALDEYGR